MIKIIATIDSARGLDGGWNLPSVEAYQTNKLVKGRLQALQHEFSSLADMDDYFAENRNVCAVGGSKLYEQMLPYADQLLITQINGIYDCSAYFPSFEKEFVLRKKSRIHKEHGVEFQHQVWVSKSLADAENARNANARES